MYTMKSFWVCLVLLLQVFHVKSNDSSDLLELSCSDNATCIDNLTKELIRNVNENKTIKVFDLFTIEPIEYLGEGRSNEGPLAKFFNSHAIKVDFGKYAVRVIRGARNVASLGLELEENSPSNMEGRARRGRNKKLMQVFLPMLLGFKAASSLIVAIAAVALLTFKAFLASKLALLVTITMAVKKLMESFGGGMAMQHQPYLYNQYPVEFPSAGTHPGYTMGASAYASPEMYGITGLAGHAHEMLQQPASLEPGHDSSGQYSQNFAGIQSPNITSKFGQTASKRWDGTYSKKSQENSHVAHANTLQRRSDDSDIEYESDEIQMDNHDTYNITLNDFIKRKSIFVPREAKADEKDILYLRNRSIGNGKGLKRKSMYYENTRPSSDGNSGYQEYDS